jgi:class 3 adenylate cyclase
VDGIGWFLRNDLWIPDSVVVDVKNMIPDEDREARRITSLPITRTFVCLDVSDFSKYTPGEEALIINSIVSILSQEHNWRNAGSVVRTAHEAMMCIGDGYIFVFREAIKGAYFAAYVAQLIEALVARRKLPVDFHFRIGVHVGEVYSFWDPGRQDWNYIGEGINGGNRVLSAIDKGYDDQVFVSGDVRKAIMASPDADFEYKKLLANLHNRGRRPDKHGRPWRVYELNHTAFCAGDLPLDLGGE